MRQVYETLRWIACPAGVARSGLAALALAASVANAQAPTRSHGPYLAGDQGFGLASPIDLSDPPVLEQADGRVAPEYGEVVTADWLDNVEAASDDGIDAADLRTVTPVSSETESATDSAPLGPSELTANDPLSRLRWSSAAERVDPAETLRDWAEGAGLLVAFVVVSLWIVRQWLTKRTQPGGPTTHMRTIESLTLPQRCRVHLVDVGGQQVLVAADAAGVKCITVLPDRFSSLLDAADPEAAPAATNPQPDKDEIWNALRESRLA